MGFGAAITFLAIGAALTWAVEVDLPAMDDDALGAIMLCAGVISLAATVIMSASRPAGNGVAGGIGLFAAGAVLTWAIQIDLPYVFDGALGIVLMVAGAVSVAAHLIMQTQASRSRQVVERPSATRQL